MAGKSVFDLTELSKEYIKIRFLVSALGEKSSPPWWKTRFCSDTGIRMLEKIYPRTPVAAASNSSAQIARRIHDQTIGSRGVYHLFRLPDNFEQKIQELLSSDNELIKEFRLQKFDFEDLISSLQSFSGSEISHIANGPIKMGNINDLFSSSAVTKICSAYLYGFTNNIQVFPYFKEEERETN